MGCLFVVFEGRTVAKDRGAQRARYDLTGVRRSDVPIEAGLSREFGLALTAFESLFGIVGFHVSSQGLFVFKGRSAVGARKGCSRTRVQSFVD